jgi:hypothetical protein
MTAPYSLLVPESELSRRTAVIRVAHDKPDHMSAERQKLLAEAAWYVYEELGRTRGLLGEVAPDLVQRFA